MTSVTWLTDSLLLFKESAREFVAETLQDSADNMHPVTIIYIYGLDPRKEAIVPISILVLTPNERRISLFYGDVLIDTRPARRFFLTQPAMGGGAGYSNTKS